MSCQLQLQKEREREDRAPQIPQKDRVFRCISIESRLKPSRDKAETSTLHNPPPTVSLRRQLGVCTQYLKCWLQGYFEQLLQQVSQGLQAQALEANVNRHAFQSLRAPLNLRDVFISLLSTGAVVDACLGAAVVSTPSPTGWTRIDVSLQHSGSHGWRWPNDLAIQGPTGARRGRRGRRGKRAIPDHELGPKLPCEQRESPTGPAPFLQASVREVEGTKSRPTLANSTGRIIKSSTEVTTTAAKDYLVGSLMENCGDPPRVDDDCDLCSSLRALQRHNPPVEENLSLDHQCGCRPGSRQTPRKAFQVTITWTARLSAGVSEEDTRGQKIIFDALTM